MANSKLQMPANYMALNESDIVHRGVNRTAMHLSSTFAQGFHHVLLDFRGFDHDSFKLGFRNRQMQLVGSLDVRCLLEHIHQLRQVKELGKTCARTVAGSFGLDFVKRFSVIFLNSSGCLQGSPL